MRVEGGGYEGGDGGDVFFGFEPGAERGDAVFDEVEAGAGHDVVFVVVGEGDDVFGNAEGGADFGAGELAVLEELEVGAGEGRADDFGTVAEEQGGVGDSGAANALNPDSSPAVGSSEYDHHFEVWTGVSWNAAANMYAWGRRTGDGALMAEALLTGWGTYSRSWQDEKAAYWFSTPEAWRIDDPTRYRALMYQRARAAWELLREVEGR